MNTIEMPDFYMPFPAKVNPKLEAAAAEAKDWARKHKLITTPLSENRFDSALYGEFAARVYPHASHDRLAVTAEWCAWLFFFDDHFDDCFLGRRPSEATTLLSRLLSFLTFQNGMPEAATPLDTSLADLWHRTTSLMSQQWTNRFAQHLRDYMSSYSWEVSNREKRHIPDMIMYIEMRRDTGGIRPCFDLIEYVEGVEIPDALRQELPLRTMELAAMDVVCITNDITSFNKEIARGEVNNIVRVADAVLGNGLQFAVEVVNTLQSSRIRLFLEQRDRLEVSLGRNGLHDDASREALKLYTEGLEYWVRGNLDWSLRTSRYLAVEEHPRLNGRVSWTEEISDASTASLLAPNAD